MAAPPLHFLVPEDFNGYVPVARAALRLHADEVLAGDILILDGYVTPVRHVDHLVLQRHGTVIKFEGPLNVVRFPHEIVSVIRPDQDAAPAPHCIRCGRVGEECLCAAWKQATGL